MFSIFKKVSDEQEVVLQDLTEEQLAQAAGGRDNDHDWDDRKKWVKHHHHHHHHHSHSHSHKKVAPKTSWSSSSSNGYTTTNGMHW